MENTITPFKKNFHSQSKTMTGLEIYSENIEVFMSLMNKAAMTAVWLTSES